MLNFLTQSWHAHPIWFTIAAILLSFMLLRCLGNMLGCAIVGFLIGVLIGLVTFGGVLGIIVLAIWGIVMFVYWIVGCIQERRKNK